MALKSVVKVLDEVPEALREHYVEQNGEFVLNSDAVDRVREFRATNINLLKAQDGLKTQLLELQTRLSAFDGMNADEVKALMARKDQLENKSLLEKGEVEKFVEKKLGEQAQNYERRIGGLEAKLQQAEADLSRTRFTDELTRTGAKAGVDPLLIEDAVFLASREWAMENNTPVRKVNGVAVVSADDPGKNQTMEEYWQEIAQKKPQFFLSSSGGGGQHTGVTPPKPVKTIPNDPRLIGQHAEQIAKGEVVVEGTV